MEPDAAGRCHAIQDAFAGRWSRPELGGALGGGEGGGVLGGAGVAGGVGGGVDWVSAPPPQPLSDNDVASTKMHTDPRIRRGLPETVLRAE